MDEDTLVEAIVRVKRRSPLVTAKEVHEALTKEGRELTLAQVKKASSKATKRLEREKQETQEEQEADDRPGIQELEKLLMRTLLDGKRPEIDGETSEKIAVEMGALPYDVQLRMPAAERNAYTKARLQKLEQSGMTGDFHASQKKAMQQLEDAQRSGRAPSRGERVVGFITGQEPPEERALMWVDLLLSPSGKASLLGMPAWLTNDFIGYDALKKGMNADALEGMCAFLGLAFMVAGGVAEEHGAVVKALSQRGAGTADALLQWIAHQPVGQTFLYRGNWKRPRQSPASLPLSPMVYTEAAGKMMNALVRLLNFMVDLQTYVLHGDKNASDFAFEGLLHSAHLPNAVARLVQIIAKRDTLAASEHSSLAELPSLATRALHAFSRWAEKDGKKAPVKAALRAHPRAGEVLATLWSPEVQSTEMQELGCLLEICRSDSSASPHPLPPLPGNGCGYCGASTEHFIDYKCKAVTYCDVICRKLHLRTHRQTCPKCQATLEAKRASRPAPSDLEVDAPDVD